VRRAAALLFLLAAAARAQEPLVTDRPDFTESAETVPAGRFQLEAGVTHERVGQGDVDLTTFGEALLRIGIAERLELHVGLPSFGRVETAGNSLSGWTDGSLGLKWKLAALPAGSGGRGGLDLALLAGTSAPSGDNDFTSDAWEPEVKLAAATTLTERAALSGNVGWARAADFDERFDRYSGSLSLGLAWNDRLGSYFEVYGFDGEAPFEGSSSFANSGFTWLLSDDLQLDLRVGTGLGDSEPEWFVGAGFGARW
jgi:Putative MetA-pathway of phenol degradation